jgi:hypothetical protein
MTTRAGRYMGQFRPEFSRVHQDRDLYWVVPFAAPLVLAIIGPRFAGVTTALRYLGERHGFTVYSMGGQLRRIAEGRGVPIDSRRYLQDLGDELRTEHQDAAHLARVAGRQIRLDGLGQRRTIHTSRKIVMSGIRHPLELDVLQQLNGFHLVIINCGGDEATLRFERVVNTGILRAEYEADRERRRLDRDDHATVQSWAALSIAERRAYFDSLDHAHRVGNRSRFPEAYRGRPAEVIARAREIVRDPDARVHLIDNSTNQIDDLYGAVDALLDMLRPPAEVVRRGSRSR